MHELKESLAVVRFASQRVQKSVAKDDHRLSKFLTELKADLGSRALPSHQVPANWSDRETALLLYGVMKYGEGQWTNMLEGNEFD